MRKKLKMKTMYIKPTSEAIYIGMMPMMVGTNTSLSEKDNTLDDRSTQTTSTAPPTGGDEAHSGDDDLDAAKRYGWYTGEFGE